MALRFVKIQTMEAAVSYVAGKLRSHLEAGERVLWLVSGGSVIKLAVAVARDLAGAPLGHLTLSLTDERPGPAGHTDSNWRGLMAAGLELPRATLVPVLSGHGTEAETRAFDRFLREQLERADFKLGLFGIGPDGHTAGLPAQDAAESEHLADYYRSDLFLEVSASPDRISCTPAAISRLTEAVIYVMGDIKHVQLDRLREDLPFETQSAQALKHAPATTIFNDYIGEAA
jgi:6-phosphogluconolactonase/glucosamine-6-phosphate isomerase/deaminase